MLLEDEDTVEIEKIISHRSTGNDLKYKIKHEGSDDVEWVSANYLKCYNVNLLKAYDQENNIYENISKINTVKDVIPNMENIPEDVQDDSFFENSGCLALKFADLFGIKMEVAMCNDEPCETINNLSTTDIQFEEETKCSNDLEKHEQPPTVEMTVEYNYEEEIIGKMVDDELIENMSYSTIVREIQLESSELTTNDATKPLDNGSSKDLDDMETDERRDQASNSVILQNIQFGASEYTSNEIIKQNRPEVIPTLETRDLDSRSSEDIDTSISAMKLTDTSSVVEETETQNAKPFSSESEIIELDSLHLKTTDQGSDETQESAILQNTEIRNSLDDNDKDNNKQLGTVASSRNLRIRKSNKVAKPLSDSKVTEDIKIVKSLLLPSQLSITDDPIDEIFYQLPVVTKLVPQSKEISAEELQPLTISILLSIINTNNLDLLHRYSQRDRANLETILKNNQFFLVEAVNNDFISMVGALLELGADVDGKDLNGRSSLLVACEHENEAIIDILINNGASINLQRDGKNILLSSCINADKLISLKILLNSGIEFSSIENSITDPLSPIGKILQNHKNSLLASFEENILVQLGKHVQINKIIMAPRVYSLFELQENTLEVTFMSNISPIIENHCNLLFLVTGLLHGSIMKMILGDTNGITSVILNEIEQQSLIQGKCISVTSFNPVKDDLNRIVLHFVMEKCRKIRLILVAFNVTILD